MELEEEYPCYKVRHCLHDDLQGLRKARVYGEVDSRQTIGWLARICRDAARADFFSTLVLNDLKPTLGIYWNMLTRLIAQGKRSSTAGATAPTTESLDHDHLAVQSSSASGVFRRIEPGREN